LELQVENRLKVLIVDDRKENLFALTNVLSKLDVEVIQAMDGNSALATTLNHDFALAILDVQMPEMDGFELAMLLREDEKTRHIPIIFLTAAHRDEEHQFAGYDAGAVDYIIKPYNPKVLLSKVRIFLELANFKANLEDIITERTAQIKHLNELLRASHEINRSITSESNTSQLLQNVCKKLVATRKYPYAWIAQLDRNGTVNSITQIGRNSLLEDLRAFLNDQRSSNYISELLASKKEYGEVNLPSELFKEITGNELDARNVSFPLEHHGHIFGILSVALDNSPLDDWQERGLLHEVAEAISIALYSREMEKRQQESESALKDAEELFKITMQATDAGLWYWNIKSGELQINKRWASLIGYDLNDLHPLTMETRKKLCHPEDYLIAQKKMEEHFNQQTDLYECEIRMKHKDGHWVWLLDRGMVVDWDINDAPIRMAGTHMDISTRKELEEDLFHAQKMDSIGRLAGGIAHDFNNLLTVINGYSEMLFRTPDFKDGVHEKIKNIFEAGKRAQALTNQLLMFSRKQQIKPRALDITKTLSDSVKLYRRMLGETITIEFKPCKLNSIILADPHQIDQVMANLLINARDAINEKNDPNNSRKITVSLTQEKFSRSKVAKKFGIEPGKWFILSVTDTGIGMDRDTLREIFEPFFTTKSEGDGTGLGLSTVYGIVKQNHGNIIVESEPGNGSVFKIFWPLVEIPDESTSTDNSVVNPREGNEKILFVEDEVRVRKVAASGLRNLGYEVETAGSWEEVLKLIDDGRFEPDILITDLVLPGKNGRDLAMELENKIKNLKVIYVSGYTEKAIELYGISDSMYFVQKPFTMHELTHLIGKIAQE
jgi:PAS domain S-box-containing protein